MPYHVDDNHPGCSGSAVVNTDTGDMVPGGCHPSHEMAVNHMKALYANVPDAAQGQGKTMKMSHSNGVFLRSYPLEDIRILSRAQGSEFADGRTVEAYAAVFDRKAEIRDGQGHYIEVIDRNSFNKAIQDAKPQGSRQTWRTGVFYNHGMTIHGTPSDRGSMPIGSPIDIRSEPAGLLTVTRYNNNPLADEVLEAIRSGDITGQSFSGRIVRSDPTAGRRGYEPARDGSLPTVRRMELGLREYGPTPFPAYMDAAVVSVRSAIMAALLSTTSQEDIIEELVDAGVEPAEAERMVTDTEPVESDTSPDEEAVPDEPPAAAEHSSRDSDPQRADLLRKIAAARALLPGLTRREGSSS